jgi:hypothetical protein
MPDCRVGERRQQSGVRFSSTPPFERVRASICRDGDCPARRPERKEMLGAPRDSQVISPIGNVVVDDLVNVIDMPNHADLSLRGSIVFSA